MFAHCKGPVWQLDDFSRCFEQDYLQTLFPLITCGVSLLYLSYQLYRIAAKSKYVQAYKALNHVGHVWDIHVPAADRNGQSPYLDEDEETEFDRNEALSLQPTHTQTEASVYTVDRPRGEFLVVVVEELAVLAEVGIHLAALIAHTNGHKGTIASIAGLVTWTYIAVLATMRLLFSSTSKWSFPKLWYHTAFIYGTLWCFAALLFRSALVHPRSRLAQALTITDFALVSILFLIAITSRKGNRAVELEYEGDLEPAREQVASVLSLATFSWVDAIVYAGYKKTMEMTDVWNLAPHDKAAYVLGDYRQVKKTSILAWHLLKYFKRQLLIQATWAAVAGALPFAPTLLLKAILEYIEDPSQTPRNAAWFYVALLFVSGCANGLSNGQALWIGRRVCIRLRAIIVGELYSKSLKRKVAIASEKVLGQENKNDDEPKQKLSTRIKSFGRKKKATDAAKDGTNGDLPKDTKKDEGQVSSGTIINLMAVDSFKVAEISAYLHFLWAEAPVQIIIAIILLYRILGNSSIAGIGMMAFLLPINLVISKKFATIQKLILAATDARIHTTNEVLTNIRIIKFFAWEQRFMGQVNEKRTVELKHLRGRYIWWSIAATVWSGAPILITFLSFLVYTMVEKKDLIPSIAFTALSLFQILRIPLDQIADMVAHVQESKVSVDRIEEFLNEPDTEKYKQLAHPELDDDGDPIIGFDKATFSWGSNDPADESFKLLDMDVKFQVGQLNVVIGPTGCGKTSLLMALLGEMTLLDGSVYLPGACSREELNVDPDTGLTESVAYCAQQAWLVNDTVKQNIIFASPWNPTRYNNVINACSLKRDLEILDNGDETLVGEKGVTLSGGQKQRISLARALYSHARHLLLDDVLSAVDSHTAKWIFDKALLGPLMYNRTCILVTHNVALSLPHAQFGVVLENGRVIAQGNANEIIDSGKLSEDLTKSRPASKAPSRVNSEPQSDDEGDSLNDRNGHLDGAANGSAKKPADEGTQVSSSAPHTETKAVGGVKLGIIVFYLKAMGPWWYWTAAAAVFAAQQVSSVSTNLWIREWANAYATQGIRVQGLQHKSPVMQVGGIRSTSSLNVGNSIWNLPFFSNSTSNDVFVSSETAQARMHSGDVNAGYYLGVYAVLGAAYMVITLVREGVLFGGSLAASRRVHQRLMENVMRAKFRFFDSTPLGQLMNRFSKDIEAVDQEIAPVAVGVVHCLASIFTIVVLISVITPAFLVAAIFITILYALIARFYISSSRDLKRLESVQRSPLYQQFGETLSGMTTIRAYGDERRFIRDNLARVNTHNRPFIYLWAANRWLAFRVDVVGALVSFFTGLFVVYSAGRIDAGAAGLAMTYAVTFTENVLWFVRLYASNEQNMNSVERIKEYLDVEQEAKAVLPENRPPANWPSQGAVEFIGYSTRYRKDFDLVLKHLTFKILPGEKVGVVGRTGAGKSSLAMALFRALEAEEGKILVDGVDIGYIGLQDLRENIVMVPQDPTLFTGTIRTNLDPFGLFTDEEILTALRRVQLIGSPLSATDTPIRPSTPNAANALDGTPENPSTPTLAENKNIFHNLNSPVTESGSNLSQGQRQLLCLARALLKAPKVLLMDEATASIDYNTDAKIQETIREIKNTTITIAHRLQTIIDYDKVLVLDRGEVIEYGEPVELLEKKDGIFRGMCEMTGDFEALEEDAKKAHKARKLIDVDGE